MSGHTFCLASFVQTTDRLVVRNFHLCDAQEQREAGT